MMETKHAKYLTTVDVSKLRDKLISRPELFGKYNERKYGTEHSDMEDIWVRYNHRKNLGPNFSDEHSSVWYPVIDDLPEVLDITFELMSLVRGERLGGVLITKLPPGGRIKSHIDRGWHARYYQKFWVAVKNHKGAKFCWNNIEVDPDPGEVWQFRNDVPHWVINDSDEDRIAMIICIRTLRNSLNVLNR